jgi:RND family efflux transporter MFP subunit
MANVNDSRIDRARRLLVAAVVLCTAHGLAGCSHQSADGAAGNETPKVTVTVTRVARADISRMLTLTGTAAALPNEDVRVSALPAGRIVELKVAEGDRVRAGELVARLDSRPYQQQLQQAESAVEQSKASLANAKLSFARNRDLFNRGIAARKDMEDAQTQESLAMAADQQAEAALELARLQVARTQVLSPLNGQVVKRFMNVGEQVDGTGAQPIVEIANLSEVEFPGNASALYLAKMHAGEQVDVTTTSVPGKKFPAKVIAISPAVDPSTGVGTVRIRIPNPIGEIRMGVFLSAEIPVENHAHALVVPAEAIYRDEEGNTRVFLVDGDTASAVTVKTGIEANNEVELLSGVKEGDTIIRTGGYGLGDKSQIQVSSSPRQ